jgi:20S proteasome subunit beta 2
MVAGSACQKPGLTPRKLNPDVAPVPQTMKTGTTIAGIVYKDGVVLGADTRATGGSEVADKNCQKIHYLAPNIYCCGAGTAADTEKTTELIRSVEDTDDLLIVY